MKWIQMPRLRRTHLSLLSIYVRFDVLQADIDGLGQRHNENKQI